MPIFTFIPLAPPINLWDMITRLQSVSSSPSTDPRATRTARSARRAALAFATLTAISSIALAACFPEGGTHSDSSSESSQSAESSDAQTNAALTAQGNQASKENDDNICATNALDITTTEPHGAAGSTLYSITFTNKGDAPCVLNGFPGVSLVTDNNGTQLGASATREKNVEYQPVTIAKGQSATANLKLTSTGPLDPSKCEPTKADGLRVYPPAETSAAFIPMENLEGCAGDVPVLSIQPVVESE